MRSTHTALALISAVVLVLAASIAVPRGTPGADREIAQIQAHLERVERDLLARDVSRLTPAQRTARARNIGFLREYRERGIFAYDPRIAGEHAAGCADPRDPLCAVAYLIARSGRPELARRIATMDDDASTPELASDPELAAWLEEAGLTLDELARIRSSGAPGDSFADPERKEAAERHSAFGGSGVT
ncbi:MAG TPA: hypothetical protein VF188_09315 [Longimicrobiales bacterium]